MVIRSGTREKFSNANEEKWLRKEKCSKAHENNGRHLRLWWITSEKIPISIARTTNVMITQWIHATKNYSDHRNGFVLKSKRFKFDFFIFPEQQKKNLTDFYRSFFFFDWKFVCTKWSKWAAINRRHSCLWHKPEQGRERESKIQGRRRKFVHGERA